MNPPLETPIDSDFQPLLAVIYGKHAIVLIPRGDKWEVRTIYVSPVCLAKLLSEILLWHIAILPLQKSKNILV